MNKVYVVYDTYLDDEPVMDVIEEKDLARYKEQKFKEWEKRLKDTFEVVLSMERKDKHEEQYNDGWFELAAIVHLKKDDGNKFNMSYSAMYEPKTIWSE